MAVKLRLMRMGKKKQPTYRLVAADGRSPRDGRFIEIVGTYEPRADPSVIKIDDLKALKWLRQGAQPTETVEKLLKINGTWDHFKGGTTPDPAASVVAEPAAPVTAKPVTAEPTPEPVAAEPVAAEAAEPVAADESADTADDESADTADAESAASE